MTSAQNAKATPTLTWKTPDVVGETVKRVRAFLQSHTPVAV